MALRLGARWGWLALLAGLVPGAAAAQHITIDGRFSPAQTLTAVGGTYAIGAGLGKQVGGNLFQSFGQFGLSAGQTAAFGGPAAIRNVIGGVTGGSPSSINGKIQSTIAGANLYLINPSGIVFGPHASVSVAGSFHASTADYLKLADGTRFQVTHTNGTLSAAAPAAFGFLTARPAAITVNGSTLGPVPGTLGLVGGPVAVTGGTLKAPAGTIQVASVAGAGEVPVDPRNTAALTATSFGPVGITGGATLDVSNKSNPGAGGSVFIRSGALTIEGSQINADNYGPGAGGQIVLRGDSRVALSNAANVHSVAMGNGGGAAITISTARTGVISSDASTVLTKNTGAGYGGPLSVSTGQLTLTAGAILKSLAAGSGKGGDIAVDVAGLLEIDGLGRPPLAVGISATGIASLSQASATGPPGNIAISAGSLSIRYWGGIASSTSGSARSGNVSVAVAGPLTIDQASTTGIELGDILGIESQSNPGSTGKAGGVAISAGTLSITNTGQLGSPTFGAGDGGNVLVDVAGLLKIDGAGSIGPFLTGIAASVQPGSAGNAGGLAITAGQLSIIDGEILNGAIGTFGTAPASTGNAGNITVDVADTLSIDGAGSQSLTGIVGPTALGTRGNAGDIVVNAGSLSITGDGSITAYTEGTGYAGSVSVNAGTITLQSLGNISSNTYGSDGGGTPPVNDAGAVSVTAGTLNFLTNGQISSGTFGSGNAGSVFVNAGNTLTINGISANPNYETGISTDAEEGSKGKAGTVTVNAGALTIAGGGAISSSTRGSGAAGDVTVTATHNLVLDSAGSENRSQIDADSFGSGKAGVVTVFGQNITLSGGSYISSEPNGSGAGGDVTVTAARDLLLDSTGSDNQSEIDTDSYGSGRAGVVTVFGQNIALRGGSYISSEANSTGAGGDVTVTAANNLLIDSAGSYNQSEIDTDTFGSAQAGVVTVSGRNITLRGASYISSDAASSNPADRGNSGSVTVTASGTLLVDATGAVDSNSTYISSDTSDAGAAGSVTVSAPNLELRAGGEVDTDSYASGKAGVVTVSGQNITLSGGSFISSDAASSNPVDRGNAGTVTVTATGAILLDGTGSPDSTYISSNTYDAGAAGSVTVSASNLELRSGGEISSSNEGGAGNAGDVTVAAGALAVLSNGEISSDTFGLGKGGNVSVNIQGQLTIDATSADPNFLTGISSQADRGSTGNAGSVAVNSGALSIINGGAISASTDGLGAGGDVMVNVADDIVITGIGNATTTGIFARTTDPEGGNAGQIAVAADNIMMLGAGVISTSTYGGGNAGEISVDAAAQLAIDGSGTPGIITGIASSANSGTGNAGQITVAANSLWISGGGEIQSLTFTSGNGGDIIVASAGQVQIKGSGAALPTGILTDARPGSTGRAGAIELSGQNITIAGGGLVSSSTAGAGNDSGIVALPAPAASGNAGSVMVTAPQITIATGGEIASTTAGGGSGGSVDVTTPGALLLDGAGLANTGIFASATGPQSGSGGDVRVAAGSLLIEGGAQIASSTAGPGKGGEVAVSVAGDVDLTGPGPQITARSTGSGDAGSITLSAVRLLTGNGAGISTEAATSTASGGNITLSVGDFLYLVNSEITTSVKGETGNGGNILIDPQFVILDHSNIIAQAVEGHGGNITIDAGAYIASADSIVSASSQLGVSGLVTIDGPLVDLNGTLVVLSSELRNAVALTRDSCAAKANRPQSSLVEAGRGGLPQDPDATLPALYLAGRDLPSAPHAAADPSADPTIATGTRSALHTTLHLTMLCGAR